MVNKKIQNIFSTFIKWLKKIFHIRPEPIKEIPIEVPREEEKPPSPEEEPSDNKPHEKENSQISNEKEIKGTLISEEEKASKTSSEKKPGETKPPEGKTPEVPQVQKGPPPEAPTKEPKKETPTSETVQIDKKITRKPHIKKPSPEEREKEHRKISGEENGTTSAVHPAEIDLGKRKKSGGIKQPRKPEEDVRESLKKEMEKGTFIRAPCLELDLDDAKVFFIIPKQQFETNAVNNIPQQLHYKLELNGNEQSISVRVSNIEQSIATVEEKRIEVKQPLKKFKITYPNELQGRVYSYQYTDETFYAFIAIGNNRGRMYYLYNKEKNRNPLPNKDIWILLEENFDLVTEPDVIEEIRIWEKYRPLRINLKDKNEIVIKNSQTEEEEKITCEMSFSMECEALIEDDFIDQMPLFVGNSIKIEAPIVNQSGWVILVQNKQAGYNIITENWTGDKPLELKLPDNLPCECGEFQVDICEQEVRIPIETLFFRYIPYLQLEFPRDLIIPDPNTGHKQEIIKILLKKDFQDWELKLEEAFTHENIENGYQIELPPQQDVIRFSLIKKDKPETETNIKITIPRLKWKTSKNEKWYDRPIQIKRDELIPGIDFYLTVCINDFGTKYELRAILETNGQRLQEANFNRKGMFYNLLLNQFYDTVRGDGNRIKLSIEIRKAKDNVVLGQIEVVHFPEVVREETKGMPSVTTRISENESGGKDIKHKELRDIKPTVKGGNGRFRKGKGFSRRELRDAGINMECIKRLHIPLDKRRKSIYSENVETLKSLAGGK
ncbi:MAG: ribosomal protein L13e [Verrucomicrobiia bacterium]